MLWSAHGVKFFPTGTDLQMAYVSKDMKVIPAMPRLSYILSESVLQRLLHDLIAVSDISFEQSICHNRKVLRVPLKPAPITPEEERHLTEAFDGLSHFEPLHLYNHNIQSHPGLLQCLLELQKIERFGLPDGPSRYTSLLSDIGIYWNIIHIMYSFTGLASWRCDLFLLLGVWHTYLNAHVTIWREFRSTFLADAWFACFPDSRLFFKPKLIQSVTFFAWIRLAYPKFRGLLLHSLRYLKALATCHDYVQILLLSSRKGPFERNIFLERYVRLHNLFYLLEYILPATADYGTTIKMNDYSLFMQSLKRLIKVYVETKRAGSALYTNGLYLFYATLLYWEENSLPIATLFTRCHTLFSEESGELCLSLLQRSIPSQSRSDYETAKRAWRLCKHRYDLVREQQRDGRLPKIKKKHRHLCE